MTEKLSTADEAVNTSILLNAINLGTLALEARVGKELTARVDGVDLSQDGIADSLAARMRSKLQNKGVLK